MPDVLLIQPPIRDFYLTTKRTIPYGLASIAAALIQAGFSVEIVDALATPKSRRIDTPEEMAYLHPYYGRPDVSPFGLFHHFRHFGYSYQHIGRLARESGAFLVGISALFTPYIEEAIETARAVKTFHPDCKTVLGGHHPTVLPETVLKSEAVDFVLRGEGEVALPALAKAIVQRRPVTSVPGIVYRNADGSIRVREPAIAEYLDENPPPADHLIRHSYYRRGEKGCVVVSASRGCPMTCSYCSVNAASCFKYRRRSVSTVIGEIETALRKDDSWFVDFEDENLTLDRAWFLSFLKEISGRFENKDLELRAMNGLYPPSLDRDLVRAMKGAGFRTLNLALGSSDREQLKRFKRPDVTTAFDRALDIAEEFGLNAVGYIIIGAPFQSPGSSLTDLLFLAKRRVLAGVSVFYPSPGSSDYLLCEQSGMLPPSFSLMRSTAFPISHTTTRLEAVTLLRLGRIVNFMKQVLDRGEPMPDPSPMAPISVGKAGDRFEIGKNLLAAFLYDGRIWGMEPGGESYTHSISRDLAEEFLKGIHRVRGCV